MPLRITSLKFVTPPLPGYKRVYEQCKYCDRVYYRDYVPYSLSNPVLVMPCGHGLTERHHARVRGLPDQDGMLLMIEQRAAALAAKA